MTELEKKNNEIIARHTELSNNFFLLNKMYKDLEKKIADLEDNLGRRDATLSFDIIEKEKQVESLINRIDITNRELQNIQSEAATKKLFLDNEIAKLEEDIAVRKKLSAQMTNKNIEDMALAKEELGKVESEIKSNKEQLGIIKDAIQESSSTLKEQESKYSAALQSIVELSVKKETLVADIEQLSVWLKERETLLVTKESELNEVESGIERRRLWLEEKERELLTMAEKVTADMKSSTEYIESERQKNNSISLGLEEKEKQLQQKEDRLILKGVWISVKEETLSKQEQTMAEREKVLLSKEQEFFHKETQLNYKEQLILDREVEVSSKEEMSLAAFEEATKKLEEANSIESQFVWREKKLSDLEAWLLFRQEQIDIEFAKLERERQRSLLRNA